MLRAAYDILADGRLDHLKVAGANPDPSDVPHFSRLTSPPTQPFLSEYIEVFYNRERAEEGLGHKSPAAYEATFSAA